MIVTTSAIFGQGRQSDSLQGLNVMAVIVEPLGPKLVGDGLETASIQTDAELKLRLAGIKVISGEQVRNNPALMVENASAGLLHIVLTTTSVKGHYPYPVSTRIELLQNLNFVRNGKLSTIAPTWHVGSVAMIHGPSQISQFREAIKDAIDEFINDSLR